MKTTHLHVVDSYFTKYNQHFGYV